MVAGGAPRPDHHRRRRDDWHGRARTGPRDPAGTDDPTGPATGDASAAGLPAIPGRQGPDHPRPVHCGRAARRDRRRYGGRTDDADPGPVTVRRPDVPGARSPEPGRRDRRLPGSLHGQSGKRRVAGRGAVRVRSVGRRRPAGDGVVARPGARPALGRSRRPGPLHAVLPADRRSCAGAARPSRCRRARPVHGSRGPPAPPRRDGLVHRRTGGLVRRGDRRPSARRGVVDGDPARPGDRGLGGHPAGRVAAVDDRAGQAPGRSIQGDRRPVRSGRRSVADPAPRLRLVEGLHPRYRPARVTHRRRPAGPGAEGHRCPGFTDEPDDVRDRAWVGRRPRRRESRTGRCPNPARRLTDQRRAHLAGRPRRHPRRVGGERLPGHLRERHGGPAST